MAKEIIIRFYEELNDFLPSQIRKQDIRYSASNHQNIKDIIEALGIPHSEVDLILVNGISIDFNYKPAENDRFSIYPVFESLNIQELSRLRPEPLRELRFILDVHLGKLARYLRMLGYDSYYRNDLEDREIVIISGESNRIILTRDLQLLKHKTVTHGYYIRATDPHEQIKEVACRFNLDLTRKPFSICMECNGQLKPVDKSEIDDRLEPGTRKYFNEFYICDSCEKIYWAGSHLEKMKEMIRSL